MPELPEVETVKNGLKELLQGLKIKSVNYDWPKGFPNSKHDVNKYLIGSTVKNVRRRAKVLMVDLSSGYSLVVHLKMTGQLVFVGPADKQELGDRSLELEKTQTSDLETPNSQPLTPKTELARFSGGHPTKSMVGPLPDKSTRIIIEFENGGRLFFNDQRKFGWMKLVPSEQVNELDFIKKLGPEPLNPNFQSSQFIDRLSRRQNSSIKAALLDQTVIAGIGNIYADESLFLSKIHPASHVKAIPKKQLKILFENIKNVLKESIGKGGTTDRNFVDCLGRPGNYMDIARVFRREKQACSVCLDEIIKIRVAGRGTHVCVKCQKLYKGNK